MCCLICAPTALRQLFTSFLQMGQARSAQKTLLVGGMGGSFCPSILASCYPSSATDIPNPLRAHQPEEQVCEALGCKVHFHLFQATEPHPSA